MTQNKQYIEQHKNLVEDEGKKLAVAYSTIIHWVSPVENIRNPQQGSKQSAPEYKLCMSSPEANCSVGKNTFYRKRRNIFFKHQKIPDCSGYHGVEFLLSV
jgi:hypothetical protein